MLTRANKGEGVKNGRNNAKIVYGLPQMPLLSKTKIRFSSTVFPNFLQKTNFFIEAPKEKIDFKSLQVLAVLGKNGRI